MSGPEQPPAAIDHGRSALGGVINKLQRGEPLTAEAIEEIDRTLALLKGEGWSGFITADDALRTIIEVKR